MKLLVTGARGFIGRNLIATLNNIRLGKDKTHRIAEKITVYECNRDTSYSLLKEYCKECDFVFCLAGENRPKNEADYMEGNYHHVSVLVELLKENQNTCPVMLSSSTQAMQDNPYGISKRAAERLLFSYSEETSAPVYIYRLPNIFGKWCRPNYNSVIATFCYNIARKQPIQVNDSDAKMTLSYIDDVIDNMLGILVNEPRLDQDGFCSIEKKYRVSVGEAAELIYSFQREREEKYISKMTEGSFEKKLYATYLTYLPESELKYPLKMNIDHRGSFTELFKTLDRGQVSVNITKPGVVKGEHWHHTKNEKFAVVSGEGLIQLRQIDKNEIINYTVSGDKMEVIDIPPGYTHNIANVGKTDLVTIMWCNECFNPQKPDTYALKVNEEDTIE